MNEEEKTEEEMSNRHESDEEEAMGENYHHENHSLPEGTVATLQFPIQQPEGTAAYEKYLTIGVASLPWKSGRRSRLIHFRIRYPLLQL